MNSPLSATEIDEMQQKRQHHVQNLGKYRTDAAQKYRDAFSQVANNHDDYFDKAISTGDLVMRKPINSRNKLWPKWDGPFVIVDYTDQNTYQLGSANGYVIRRLVNGERLRKLSGKEIKKYRGEFWNASSRLKVYDERAKKENELHDADMEMRRVALENMKIQKEAVEIKMRADADVEAKAQADAQAQTSMAQLSEASAKRKKIGKEYDDAKLAAKLEETRVTEAENSPSQAQVESHSRGTRVRKPSWKLRE
jgi:hypothetical protein